MRAADALHPPKARLALRIGVTGHRLNKLPEQQEDALAAQTRAALQAIADVVASISGKARELGCFSDEPPLLRIISPLAEGADRIVAAAGQDLGFDLQAVLPFPSSNYERDFESQASRECYRALLAASSAVLVLDGERVSETADRQAYRHCGITVLRQSDVLVALWDGGVAESPAGTGSIVRDALAVRMPVVWIDTGNAGSPPRVLLRLDLPHETAPLAEALAPRLHQLLLPPDAGEPGGGQTMPTKRATTGWRQYFAESWPRWALLGSAHALFVAALARASLPERLRLPRYAERRADRWLSPLQPEAGNPQAALHAAGNARLYEQLAEHYIWANQLAERYAGRYRGSFVLGFTLAPFAVLLALLGFGLSSWPTVAGLEWLWAVLELVIIALILALIMIGRRQSWHDRWLDYRFLSEQLRQMRLLAPLGRTPRTSRVPAHHDYGDPETSWASWQFRAIIREAGLFSASLGAFERTQLADACLRPTLDEQVDYHECTHARSHRIATILHRTHVSLFGLTLVMVLLHLPHAFGIHLPDWLPSTLPTALAAILPAFGAATAGLASQGEFHRMSERAQAMKQRLQRIRDTLPPGGTPTVAALGEHAEEAANLMLEEVLDWRVLFLGRPLELPA